MSVLNEILSEHTIRPSHFYAGRRRHVEETAPMRRLMLAVLRDALECIAGRAGGARGFGARNTAQEAIDWIEDANDREIFSFTSVCDALDINPDALRKSLYDWLHSGRRLERRSPVKRETAIL
jgi:hypothetical protein